MGSMIAHVEELKLDDNALGKLGSLENLRDTVDYLLSADRLTYQELIMCLGGLYTARI